MQTDGDALLAAILANPADDTVRLVYADWLDDRGEPGDAERAEFIRLGCQVAADSRPCDCVEVPDPKRPSKKLKAECEPCHDKRQLSYLLYSQAANLVVPFVRPWQGLSIGKNSIAVHTVAGIEIEMEFARGFAASVKCSADQWIEHGDAILRYHPVADVELTTTPTNQDVEHEQTGLHEHRYRVRGKDWHPEQQCEAASEQRAIYFGLFALTWRGVRFVRRIDDAAITGLVARPLFHAEPPDGFSAAMRAIVAAAMRPRPPISPARLD